MINNQINTQSHMGPGQRPQHGLPISNVGEQPTGQLFGTPTNVVIKKFIQIPTKEAYQDMFIRGYDMFVERGSVDNLASVIEQGSLRGGVTEIGLAKEAGGVISVNSNIAKQAQIANGWQTQRIRFILIVESMLSGINIVSYLQGYTEHFETSFSSLIDPNMRFFINSVTNVKKQMIPGVGMKITPYSTFNVIADNSNPSGVSYQRDTVNDIKLVRPIDIIDNIDTIQTYGHDGQVINHNDKFAMNVTTSNRSNNNPLSHLRTTINGYIDGMQSATMGHSASDVLNNVKDCVFENNIMSVPFIKALFNVTGVSSPSSFSMNELTKIQPNADSVVHRYSSANDVATSDLSRITNTERLSGNSIETVTATTVVQMLTSYMIENFLTDIAINMTNMSGRPVVIPIKSRSIIEGIDETVYMQKVVVNAMHVIMPNISKAGLLEVSVRVEINLFGDANVAVSINGQPEVIFRFPTFADASFSSIITDTQNAAVLTQSYENVLNIADQATRYE